MSCFWEILLKSTDISNYFRSIAFWSSVFSLTCQSMSKICTVFNKIFINNFFRCIPHCWCPVRFFCGGLDAPQKRYDIDKTKWLLLFSSIWFHLSVSVIFLYSSLRFYKPLNVWFSSMWKGFLKTIGIIWCKCNRCLIGSLMYGERDAFRL